MSSVAIGTALVAVWILLWGTLSPANLLSGFAVAVVVLVLVPIPGPTSPLRVRPLPALRFVVRLVIEAVRSNVAIAVDILRRPDVVDSELLVIEAPGCADELMTLLATSLSVAPGTLAIDVTRDPATVVVHVLYRGDRERVERTVADLSRLAVAAFGPDGGEVVVRHPTASTVTNGREP